MVGATLTAVTVTIPEWIREIGVTTPPIKAGRRIMVAPHIIGGIASRTARTTGPIITTVAIGIALAVNCCLDSPRQAKPAAGIPLMPARATLMPAAAFNA